MIRKSVLTLALAGLTFATIAGCPTMPPPDDGGDPVDQFEVVRGELAKYFDSDPAGAISATTVFQSLNDANELNRPYILSVRADEHYEIGHVPGAANVFWRDVANAGALADVPTDREVVVYCYTGHTGAVATAYLGAQGYDVVNMKFGMTAWTQDPAVRVAAAFNEASDANDYPLETTDNPATTTYDLPVLDVTTSTDTAEIVRAAGEAYLSSGAAPIILAEDVFTNLNDGNDTNDPFIISVRSPEHYALGHIPGAINIPWRQIVEPENLAKIPPDREIVVYCYTGHTGGLATMALTMLGYDATNMKFGIMAWTQDADVRVISPFTEENDANDFPTEAS